MEVVELVLGVEAVLDVKVELCMDGLGGGMKFVVVLRRSTSSDMLLMFRYFMR